MNKNIKRLWLDALKSGEYEQGIYCLRNSDNKFCCLGVLCDVLNVEWTLDEKMGVYDIQGERAVLPKEIAETTRIAVYVQKKLASDNDNGLTLIEIANWIEEYL